MEHSLTGYNRHKATLSSQTSNLCSCKDPVFASSLRSYALPGFAQLNIYDFFMMLLDIVFLKEKNNVGSPSKHVVVNHMSLGLCLSHVPLIAPKIEDLLQHNGTTSNTTTVSTRYQRKAFLHRQADGHP